MFLFLPQCPHANTKIVPQIRPEADSALKQSTKIKKLKKLQPSLVRKVFKETNIKKNTFKSDLVACTQSA
jgi:hypothetical protein